jgi:hypothetical protein
MDTPENSGPPAQTGSDLPVSVNIAIVIAVIFVLLAICGALLSVGKPQRATEAECPDGTVYTETYTYDHMFKIMRVNGECEPA